MDLSLLATLKQKLTASTKFSDVTDYFLTHFGEKSEFIKLGHRVEHGLLQMVVDQVANQLYGDTGRVVLTPLALTHLPEQHFIHGTCFVNGKVCSVIYFEDIFKGLISIAPPDGNCHYARFSGHPEYRPTLPSLN